MSMFNLTEVLAKNASTATVQSTITEVLHANDNCCYEEMEPHLMPPGVAGSRFYDQAYAVRILLDHDKIHGGMLHTMMIEKRMRERMVWDYLYKALKKAGFRMKSGRLIGLLEDKSDSNGDDTQGEADID